MLWIRRWIPILMLVALVGGVTDCAKKEEPKKAAEPPPPPPPTPEEIATKIVADAGLNEPLPEAGASFSKEAADKLKKVLAGAQRANKDTPEGQRALQIVNQQLDQRLRALEGAKAYEYLLGTIDGYEILNPSSPKWQMSKEAALLELQKPKVKIIGFMQDAAIVEFYLPVQKTTHKERVRPGEEFYGVTLEEVIGNNQGIRMRYGATGETFDVYTKTASKSK